MKLPIIASDTAVGQLGNTLLQSAHALAFCREYELPYVNFPFTPYADFFRSTHWNLFCSAPAFLFPPCSATTRYRVLGALRKLHKWSGHPRHVQVIELDWSEELRLDDPAFFPRIREKSLVVLRGWRFRAPHLVEKQAAALRHFFTPVDSIQQAARSIVAASRTQADVVIGVHVRQGDYATWKDGRFFYPAEAYEAQMHHLLTLFPGQRVHFILCSDRLPEPLRQSALPHSYGSGTAPGDLTTLATCDYLIGPPSSFSLWASFSGQVPLWHWATAEARPQLSDFTVCRDLIWKYDV